MLSYAAQSALKRSGTLVGLHVELHVGAECGVACPEGLARATMPEERHNALVENALAGAPPLPTTCQRAGDIVDIFGQRVGLQLAD